MLYCFGQKGDWSCPLKDECYRHTQPTPVRDRFGELPYDFQNQSCAYFLSNRPSEEFLRTRAYYSWLAAGKPGGQSEHFWQQAKEQTERRG